MKRNWIGLLVVSCILAFGFAGNAHAFMGHWGDHRMMFERMSKELGLTADQQKKVEAIIESKKEQIKKIHEEIRPRMEAIRKSVEMEIRGILTKEQQGKFQKHIDEMEKRMKDHHFMGY